MKNTGLRVTLLTTVCLAVSFAVILVIFNAVMGSYIREKALSAVDSYLETENLDAGGEEDAAGTVFNVNIVWLNADYGTEDTASLLSETDRAIAEWSAQNRMTDSTASFETINGLNICLAQQKQDDGSIYVFYADVTPEWIFVALINGIFIFSMLVCGTAAILSGILLGRKIEREEQEQKAFFENASHELKTPLMAIQGYAEGLQTGVVRDEKKASQVIIDESDKMAKMVDGILNLSRIESGQIRLEKENVPIGELLNDCLESVEIQASKKGLKIETDVVPDTVEMDRAQAERAVTNILSNAVRYAESRIRVTYAERELTVIDDGEKLSDEDLKNVFERFYTGKKGNTGIGLSLTREIVRKHGWKIRAENTEDGVQFVIRMK
jgi:signal transduction histidine kinase